MKDDREKTRCPHGSFLPQTNRTSGRLKDRDEGGGGGLRRTSGIQPLVQQRTDTLHTAGPAREFPR